MAASGEASFPASLLLVGAGRMGGALLRGWLEMGLEAHRIHVVEPQPSAQIHDLCAARGVTLGFPAAPPAALVLAIKPQMLEEAAPSFASYARETTLVVSILAGK